MYACTLSRITILVSFLLVIMVFTSPAVAEDTLLINYQGYLTDSGGDPLTTSVPMTFTIYASELSIDGLWSEAYLSVEVNSGLFNVLLGSAAALPRSIFDGSDLWLGILVNSDAEILPRTLMASVASAAVSRKVDGDIKTYPGVLEVHSPDPCDPADSCPPAFRMAAASDTNTFVVHPPDPCFPPDPCDPAFEIRTTSAVNSLKLIMPLPDDASAVASAEISTSLGEAGIIIISGQPVGSSPGLLMNAQADAGTFSVGWFEPSAGDSPPPDDSKPAAQFNMSASTATFELHGEDDALGAETFPIYMHSDGTGAKMGIGTTNLTEALCVIGNIGLTGDIVVITDTRLKTNIMPINNALEIVDGLNGVSYDWRQNKRSAKLNLSDRRQIGLLADDVEKVLPELVHHDADGNQMVAYSKLTAVLIEAVKELRAENNDLKKRIEALEAE